MSRQSSTAFVWDRKLTLLWVLMVSQSVSVSVLPDIPRDRSDTDIHTFSSGFCSKHTRRRFSLFWLQHFIRARPDRHFSVYITEIRVRLNRDSRGWVDLQLASDFERTASTEVGGQVL